KEIIATVIEVPREVLERRLTGRRTCPVGGEIYNIYFKPPKVVNVCDQHPEARLDQRTDDSPEKIRVRLETYEQQTAPLVDYYQRTGRLRRVDGNRAREEIYREIERAVNRMS